MGIKDIRFHLIYFPKYHVQISSNQTCSSNSCCLSNLELSFFNLDSSCCFCSFTEDTCFSEASSLSRFSRSCSETDKNNFTSRIYMPSVFNTKINAPLYIHRFYFLLQLMKRGSNLCGSFPKPAVDSEKHPCIDSSVVSCLSTVPLSALTCLSPQTAVLPAPTFLSTTRSCKKAPQYKLTCDDLMIFKRWESTSSISTFAGDCLIKDPDVH